jgi:two-component system sensor histidine kinase CpxA
VRTLFFRIFLWFWLAMAAVAGVLIVSSPLFTRRRPSVDRWERDAGRMVEERARRVAERIGKEGLPQAGQAKAEEDPGRPNRFYVVDLEGKELLGARVPAEVRTLAMHAAATGQPERQREGALHLAARPLRDPEGRALVVVETMRRPPGPADLLDPGWLLPRLLVLTALAGLLCFWLARHLSAPVTAVREATRRLAGGDLSARVGSSVGRRRDDVAELARDVDTMAERVVGLLDAQKRLLRDVSHEVRSPLARLGVALELARRGPEERRERALARIGEEADRLAGMVDQLLSLSRLESGVPAAEWAGLDLRALVVAVVDDAAFEAGARRCSVRLATSDACEVTGSASLLRSAVENVVRNAVRHTGEGTLVEVSLHASGPPGDRRADIRVRDHGPGIPDDRLADVFKPFFRLDEARDRARGGAGLGLAIAATAVEGHGGTIEARNAPAGGLEVTISLPARS